MAGLKVGDKVIELDSCAISDCPAEVTKNDDKKQWWNAFTTNQKNSMAAKSK